MGTILTISLIIVAFVAFFTWARIKAKSQHASFDKSDVISALNNLISDESTDHDEFDMFISWPINDPYWKAIRQKVIKITSKYSKSVNRDISIEGVNEIKCLIYEIQNHI